MNPNFSFHLASGPPPSIQPPPTHSMPNAQIQPAPAISPSQSVPGRRTPLGTVGIGGFYAQSALSPSHVQHQTDENLPSGSRERYVLLIGSVVDEFAIFFIHVHLFLEHLQTIKLRPPVNMEKRKIARAKLYD